MNERLPQDQHEEGFGFVDQEIHKQLELMEPLWAAYKDKPVGKTSRHLDKAIKSHLESVKIALEVMEKEYDEGAYFTAAMTYTRGFEQARVDMLNRLTESAQFSITSADDDEEFQEFLEDTDVPVSEAVYSMYEWALGVDKKKLDEMCVADYYEKPSTLRKERMKLIGGHALDVAKMSAGVLIGVAVAKRAKLL